LEIKDELARTLSNAITTLLINDKKEYVMGYFEELKEMYSKYGDSHKVKGAYITAKANMAKAGIKPNV